MIKNARQSGNQISVSYDGGSTSLSGELIGFTATAIFFKTNNHLIIYKIKNSGIGIQRVGIDVTFMPGDEIKMYGNCAGIKRRGSSTVFLYDENGKVTRR